jgi:amino acid transporter
VGGLGSVNNWIIAPTRGLVFATDDDQLPAIMGRTNRFGAPVFLLVAQAIIVTLIALLFLYMPSVNGSYWLLTALATQLYMLMYALMFAAAIMLRYVHAHTPRTFRVPFGKVGMWCFGVAGVIAASVTFVIGFIPPSNMDVGGALHYDFLIVVGLVLMSIPPFLIHFFRARSK